MLDVSDIFITGKISIDVSTDDDSAGFNFHIWDQTRSGFWKGRKIIYENNLTYKDNIDNVSNIQLKILHYGKYHAELKVKECTITTKLFLKEINKYVSNMLDSNSKLKKTTRNQVQKRKTVKISKLAEELKISEDLVRYIINESVKEGLLEGNYTKNHSSFFTKDSIVEIIKLKFKL